MAMPSAPTENQGAGAYQPEPKRLMTPAETIANLNAVAQKLNPEFAKDADRQMEEQKLIARTVYVGNVSPHLTETDIREFFSSCGNVIYIKVAGNPQLGIKYAFMEMDCPESAQRAMALTGSGAMLGDRPVKVGPAMNPIVKPPSAAINDDPERIETAMSRVMRAKKRLEEKKRLMMSRKSDRSSSSSRRRHKKSRSRSRHKHRHSRSHRSRSRSRHSSSRHRRNSSRKSSRKDSEERYDVHIPTYRPPAPRPVRFQTIHDGLVWDGFQWTQPSGQTIRQKSENLAAKIMDVATVDPTSVNPSAQQAMVQQAHQQAALLKAHLEKAKK